MRLLDGLVSDREEVVMYVAIQGATGRQVDEAASPKMNPPLGHFLKNRKFAILAVLPICAMRSNAIVARCNLNGAQ